MRRKTDGWVNATHILKVADFDKPQRTRILEKEIQKGTHEKIQGGYGKYQGTWVPLNVAREIAYQYQVDELLNPLLSYVESSTSPPPLAKKARKMKTENPSASRTNSKLKAKSKLNSPAEGSLSASKSFSTTALPDSPQSYMKSTQPFTQQATTIPSKKAKKLTSFPADQNQPPVVKRGRGRPPNSAKAATIAAQAAAQAAIAAGTTPVSNKKKQPAKSKYYQSSSYNDSFNLSGDDSGSVSSRSSSPSDSLSDTEIGLIEHPTPRASGMRTQEITDTPTLKKGLKRSRGDYDKDEFSRSSNKLETTPSSYQTQNSNGNIMICDNELIAAQYGRKLLDYFMAPEEDDIPDYLIHPPEGFNINHVIDDEGHTAFHWACSMGNLKIIIALLDAGANMQAVNLLGQTPLMRTVMFTNSYDLRSFAKIVELLRSTILLQDNSQRTVLHHISESTSPRSKLSSARYYTEIFLSKLSEIETMSLVESFVNRVDSKGDTALHIAARNEAKKCVKVLTSYNASTKIPNNSGFTAQDYINGYEASRHKHHGSHSNTQLQQTPSAQQQDNIPTPGPYGNYNDQGYNSLYQYNGANGDPYLKPNSSPTHAYTHVYSYDPLSTPAGDTGDGSQQIPGSASIANGRSGKRYNMTMPTPPAPPSGKNFYDGQGYIDQNQTLSALLGRVLSNVSKQQHSSDAGGSIVSKIIPSVVEKLEQLSKTYDTAITEKNTDAEQVRQLYENVKEDVKATEQQIQEYLTTYGNESTAEAKCKEAADLVSNRISQLTEVVNFSQANELSRLIQEETAKTISEDNENSTEQNHEETADLVIELYELQKRRKKHVTEIVDLWSTADASEKMHKYRRLVALSCGVKLDDIDNMLGEIEQVLSETPKNGMISSMRSVGEGLK